MPFASFKSIRGVSSEDCKYAAENLLKQSARKWKTKTIGERVAFVILELSEPHTITGIDIGNEHSAFVEVLVSKTSCNSQDFTEILVTCSFMTPIESRNSTNTNRVRCFSKEALVSSAVSEKWQFIKVICTQPFNKHVQYGISFIKIHVIDPDIDSSKIRAEEVRESSDIAKNVNSLNVSQLGKFKLREESPESDPESTTSLFKRWKSSEQKNEISKKVETYGENSKNLTKQVERNSLTKDVIKNEKPPICMDRNRHELVFGEEEEIDNDAVRKKRHRLSEKIELERQKQRLKNDKTETLKENKKCVLDTSKAIIKKITPIGIKPVKGTVPENERPEYVKKDDVKARIFRPFNQLLKGTVLVISGIQNPERANLRDKALAMGAKYRTEWETGCTHLICAFKNTPKYNQVKGKGKIVTHYWIEDCHRQKKCLPWRRYALDSSDLHNSESEEEVLEESLKLVELITVRDNSKRNDLNKDTYQHSETSSKAKVEAISSGSDTDDEIQRVLESNAGNSSYNKTKVKETSNSQKRNIFDESTEEEDFLPKKVKVAKN